MLLLVRLVDDEESTREILKTVYLNVGYETELFSCPLRALDTLTRAASSQLPQCDLVVCDLIMPGLSGLEFLDGLRSLPSPPPVILLTAHASTETAIEGLAKGATDYITKPQTAIRIISPALDRIIIKNSAKKRSATR